MAIQILSWLIAIPLLGFAAGLRTMTPIAIICWFAWRHDLSVAGTWASWTGHGLWVAILSIAAVGELIYDKLPFAGNRTAPMGLIGRILAGGLVGSISATVMNGSGLEGCMLGIVGALLGTFIGYNARRELVLRTACPSWSAAVSEDLLAIALSVLALSIING